MLKLGSANNIDIYIFNAETLIVELEKHENQQSLRTF
jgi:ADP-glucose pyrophosphorylase